VVNPIAAPEREYNVPRVSPDGKQVIATIGPGSGAGDLWKLDLAQQTLTRLTFDAKTLVGYWLPDQTGVIYQNEDTEFNIHTLKLDGDAAPRSIHDRNLPVMLTGVTPDGRWVIYAPWGTADADVLKIPIEGGEPEVVVSEPLDQSDGTVSPDGHWIAYTTRQSGDTEVVVRTFPAGPNKWQLSASGGTMPVWSPTKKEIYWISGASLYAATYETNARSISFGTARRLFELPLGRGIEADLRPYDIAPDGTRFLMTRIGHPELARRRIDVVLDFPAQLEALEKKSVTQ